jgi:hypothetical protein
LRSLHWRSPLLPFSLVGKGLLLAPRGEAMVVATSAAGPVLQPASLDESGCLAAQLLADLARPEGIGAGTERIVSFAVPAGTQRVAVVLQEIPAADPAAGPALVLAVDADGRIIAVSEDAAGAWREVANKAVQNCLPAQQAGKAPGSV